MPKLTDEELLKRAGQDLRAAMDHTRDWRDEARTAYDYRAGKQWSDEDIKKMKEEERPIITFNRIHVFIEAIKGLEVSNRQEMTYTPGEVNDTGAINIANGTAKWIKLKCDSADNQSEAFGDLVTCGMGFTETFIEYDQDLDGKICEERVDPLDIYWDAGARKKNLVDARWIGRLKKFTAEEFQENWPDFEADGLTSVLGIDDFFDETGMVPHDSDPPAYQEDNVDGGFISTVDRRVFEYQYFGKKDVVRYNNPETGEVKDVSPEEFKEIEQRVAFLGLAPLVSIKQKKRIYYRALFAGETVLEHEELPVELQDKIPDFTLQAMTGYYDRNANIWYGLVRNMIDPQNWANKYFSQMHDIFNSGIKSALWYETGTIKDEAKFEADAAKPSSKIEFEEGALSQNRVIRPEGPKIPSGTFQLHNFAVDALPSVSGLNPELLGLAGRDQPGILESQRKQAGLTILATLFDALRYYRLRQGRVLLWFTRNLVTVERLVRINGEQNAKHIDAFKAPGAQRFDINVGEAPTSPHMKERVFTMFLQIMPLLGDSAALILPMLLKYSPFPLEVVEPMLEQIRRSQEPDPQQEQLKQIAMAKEVAEIEETQSKTLLNRAKAEAEADNIDIKETKSFQELVTKLAEITVSGKMEQRKIDAGKKEK